MAHEDAMLVGQLGTIAGSVITLGGLLPDMFPFAGRVTDGASTVVSYRVVSQSPALAGAGRATYDQSASTLTITEDMVAGGSSTIPNGTAIEVYTAIDKDQASRLIAEHEAGADPHDAYYLKSAIDALLLQKAESDHTHDGVYEPAGTAATAVAEHEDAADPHTQYLQKSGGELTGPLTITELLLVDGQGIELDSRGVSGNLLTKLDIDPSGAPSISLRTYDGSSGEDTATVGVSGTTALLVSGSTGAPRGGLSIANYADYGAVIYSRQLDNSYATVYLRRDGTLDASEYETLSVGSELRFPDGAEGGVAAYDEQSRRRARVAVSGPVGVGPSHGAILVYDEAEQLVAGLGCFSDVGINLFAGDYYSIIGFDGELTTNVPALLKLSHITVTQPVDLDDVESKANSALQPSDNISLLVNDAGYITDYTVTEADVLAHEAALDKYTTDEVDALLLGKSDMGHGHTLSSISDAGTAAALDVPATGDAATGEVVKGDDSRLSDARTPTTHDHDDRYYTAAEVDALLAAKADETETIHTLTGTAVDLDRANGPIQALVMSGATTVTSSLTGGQTVEFRFTGGDTYSVTWPAGQWRDGAAPVLVGGTERVVVENYGGTLLLTYLGAWS